ncbi:MAG: hypothetical protein ACYCZX_04460 [Rhodospirillaceae bacterium]
MSHFKTFWKKFDWRPLVLFAVFVPAFWFLDKFLDDGTKATIIVMSFVADISMDVISRWKYGEWFTLKHPAYVILMPAWSAMGLVWYLPGILREYSWPSPIINGIVYIVGTVFLLLGAAVRQKSAPVRTE